MRLAALFFVPGEPDRRHLWQLQAVGAAKRIIRQWVHFGEMTEVSAWRAGLTMTVKVRLGDLTSRNILH
jgi:hypothetical protein